MKIELEDRVSGVRFQSQGAGGQVIVGGTDESDIFLPRVPYTDIGRKELQLEATPTGVVLIPLQRTNAVTVGGKRLSTDTALAYGTHELTINAHRFTLTVSP